jgi:hypothetical protein
MDFTFDTNGYLSPNKIFEIDKSVFETTFVYNDHRKALYKELQSFNEEIRRFINSPLKLWIDGSFTTQKELPKDIDFVTFVNAEPFFYYQNRFDTLAEKYKWRGLDIYYLAVYPFSHRFRFQTEYEQNDWIKVYGFDRFGIKKGFIQLIL